MNLNLNLKFNLKTKKNFFSNSFIGLVLCFLYLPIAVLIIFSFNQSKSRSHWTGFTFDWYLKLFQNTVIIKSLFNTFVIAVVSSIIATIIGTIAAIGINSLNKYLKSSIMSVTYLPIINPEIVTGVSLMLLFSFLKIEFGFTTLILAHITFNIPYVILNVLPKVRQIDKYLYDAAMDLGCGPVLAFFKVIIPEIMPGIVAGFLMSLTFSFDDFVISYFTSGPTSQTLPIVIFSMTRRKVSPEINALSTIIFISVLIILVLANFKKPTRK
ncbi:MAG: ABC transporter permease [Oscillospiraceae bacterium]|nr:ABC transporter permease [Oscillospiraceae bacterium]